MSENTIPEPIATPDSELVPERGDSSTGDVAESQVGTAKLGGVSPMVNQHKKFPILLLFLIPILVIIAVIAIYVLLQARTMYQQTVPIASFAPEPNPEVSSPSPSTTDSTTDWPEYTNTKHHFTLKYPPYYEIIADNSTNVTLGFKHDNTSDDVYTHLTISYTPQYSLNNLSKCDGITQKFPCLSISSNPSDIMVDDINSKKFDIQIGSVDSDYRIVQLSDPNIELKMDISGGGLSRTFDQILSTFKFTDQTSTYTCPPSGYVDCMPGPDSSKQKTCSPEAMAWYKTNCPDFQGGAL